MSRSIGTMRCRPLPPVLFGQLSRPSSCSRLRSRSALSITNSQGTPAKTLGALKSGEASVLRKTDSDVRTQFWVAKHAGYPWNFAV